MHFVTLGAFFISVLFLPWFVTVAIGVIAIAFYRAYLSVVIGGVLIDSLFGVPLFGNFAFFYTALFVALSLIAVFLRRTMLE